MLIFWDEVKRETNLARHRLDFADLDPEFFLGASVAPSYEGRFVALGRWKHTIVAVVFLPLGREAISVISMRPASSKERSFL